MQQSVFAINFSLEQKLNKIKVSVKPFQRVVGSRGKATRRCPQTAKAPYITECALQGLNCQKQSGGLFLQEGTLCKRERPFISFSL